MKWLDKANAAFAETPRESTAEAAEIRSTSKRSTANTAKTTIPAVLAVENEETPWTQQGSGNSASPSAIEGVPTGESSTPRDEGPPFPVNSSPRVSAQARRPIDRESPRPAGTAPQAAASLRSPEPRTATFIEFESEGRTITFAVVPADYQGSLCDGVPAIKRGSLRALLEDGTLQATVTTLAIFADIGGGAAVTRTLRHINPAGERDLRSGQTEATWDLS